MMEVPVVRGDIIDPEKATREPVSATSLNDFKKYCRFLYSDKR